MKVMGRKKYQLTKAATAGVDMLISFKLQAVHFGSGAFLEKRNES